MRMLRKLRNAMSRSRVEREIEAELRSHIEMRTADNIADGMTPEAARRDAMLRFGNPGALKEQVTAVDAGAVMDAFWRDLRYSARQLRRSPAFSVTAVVTLALAIGANVVVFGVLNSLILRPLDVPRPERLYSVVRQEQGFDTQSYPDFADFRSRNTAFSDMATYLISNAGLTTGHQTFKCWYEKVSGNYFDMLGANPAVGRVFHASDEHGANSAPYIVLSDYFWRTRLNADPAVVGATVQINHYPFTVIGVAPPGFHGTDLFLWPEFWMPIVNGQDYEDTKFLEHRGNHNQFVVARLKPEVTPAQGTDNLSAIARDLAREHPDSDEGLTARLTTPGLMGDILGDPAREFLTGVMLLAALVLLAACANLASIFAARTADRSRELAIRLAIGSSRWHVVRQMLSEAVLVSLLGGAAGMVFSGALLRLLSRWQPFPEYPVRVTVLPDIRVYALALLLSLASGVLFALLPLRQVWTTQAMELIKHSPGTFAGFRRWTFRDALLAAQIALCTLLITASFVAVRGMMRALNAPLGFDPRGIVLAETDMHMGGHTDKASPPVQKRLLEEAARLPGVVAVGMISVTPLGTSGGDSLVYRPGTTDFRPSNSAVDAKYFTISAGYLKAAGTRLIAGRDITWHDDGNAPKVALVNQDFARRFAPDGSAVGLRFMLSAKDSYEIVGIVEDGKYDSLTEAPQPAMFFPLAQDPDSNTALVVRSDAPPNEIIPELSHLLAAIDPDLPFTIHSWPDALALVLFPARVATASLGVMGGFAAMLAITGIFGMATYSVSRRLKELGIRIALGARPMQLLRAALERPAKLLLAGSTVGLLLGAGASQLLGQIVYKATPRDPWVLLGVLTTMVLLGLLAVWIPAHIALGIEPSGLLREE